MPSVSYNTAKQLTANFAEFSNVMKDHYEAMDCRECEDYIQVGIDAFHWLMRADVGARNAVLNGVGDLTEKDIDLIGGMITGWLAPCESVKNWISIQEKRGFVVSNAEEFRRCEMEVQAIVTHLQDDNETLTPAMEELRDQAMDEKANGQTEAFFSGAE